MRVAQVIELTADERATLESWVRGRRTEVRLINRAKIVLLAASGKQNKDIAAELNVCQDMVGQWRRRFVERRVAGIENDLPRRGRAPAMRSKWETTIVEAVTRRTPRAATHWSTRSLAAELGVTQSLVHRVLKSNGLKPHLVKTFQGIDDPDFDAKVRDIVGLYLSPPQNALVISVDEKTSIQALDRTQKSLPIYKGRLGTLTHDSKRNGTTTLFAAIELAHGEVIARCVPRHRHHEWIKFLRAIDEETPPELDLHLIVDNYSTHKHARVQVWLKRHPRFHVHFIPTSNSWLNVVERFFRDLDQRRLKRGSFLSVAKLVDVIHGYVAANNENPKPIVWTATVDRILEKVGRARAAPHNSPTA